MALRERLRRVLASTDELAAGDEIVEAAVHGTDRVSRCRARERSRLSGVLRSVTYSPTTDSTPTLRAELYDGSGSIELIWLGRRDVPGIVPGRRLVVTGRVSSDDGGRTLTMYNPAYTLLSRPGAA